MTSRNDPASGPGPAGTAQQEREARYGRLADHLPAITYIVELQPAPRTVYISPQVQATLGFSPAEWLADPQLWYRQVAPADRARVEETVRRHNETGAPFFLEYRMQTRERQTVWLRNSATYQPDCAGRPAIVYGVMQDITDKKQAEEALQASEERSRSILNASPDGIVIVDAGGRICMASPKAVAMTRRERTADLVGRSITDLLAPDDRERATAHLAANLQGQAQGLLEFRAVRADGSVFDAEVTTECIRDTAGRPSQIVVMVRDVTARKQAEAARREMEHNFQLLFDSMTSGFALHQIIRDAQGTPCDYRFLQVNPAFERLTGLSAETVIGRTVLQVIPQIEPGWIARYGAVATTGAPIAFDDYIRELDRHYQVVAYRPKAEHFAVIIDDITARKRTEEQLARQMDELRRWQAVTLGREGRIAELKREVNALASRLGQPPPTPRPITSNTRRRNEPDATE